MELTIIKATADHISAIKEIANDCLKDICHNILTDDDISEIMNENFADDILSNNITDNDAWFYVMNEGDRTVAFAYLTRKPDERNIGIFHNIYSLADYRDHKIVYKLFHTVVKTATNDGITEVELYIPECDQQWKDIFTKIGVEFEPWRKFDHEFGSKTMTMWPGLLTIIPAC
jgi:N-acetylglutamate synthase-like GNAT family acetyltransferase